MIPAWPGFFQRKIDQGYGTTIVQWPQGVAEPPVGWHWGAFIAWSGGSGHYLIADNGPWIVIAQQRPDLGDDCALDSAGIIEAIKQTARDHEENSTD